MAETVGVLVMAYGTPERVEDLEAYYTDIRRGRPPTPELLADLRARYDAIGGLSPLAALTRAQAAGVQAALDQQSPGRFVVGLGLKHAAPFIEDGVHALVDQGVASIVGIVLAPHFSTMSIGQYHARATEAAGETLYTGVQSWHVQPELVDLLAARAEAARARTNDPGATNLLVTAHSLPLRAVEADAKAQAGLASYEGQLTETAEAIARAAGFSWWDIAFQSAGRTPDPWLGPDVLDYIRQAADDAVESLVVCPAGFTADHLEVLYDIDIEAQRVASEVGVEVVRTASLNDDPAFCTMIADLVRAAAPRP